MATQTLQKTTVYEPYRYLDNAKEILRTKAGKQGRLYSDPKYVRMAGNTAYNGIILALKDWAEKQLNVEVPKRKRGKRGESIDFYRELLRNRNKKILKYLNEAYNNLHLFAGYDGALSVGNMEDGLYYAKEIIDWVYRQIKDKI